MSLIRMSDRAKYITMNTRMFNTSTGFGRSSTRVRVYKGVKPTSNDINTTSAHLLRASDKLIEFATGVFNDIAAFTPIFANSGAVNAVASASGTAAWALFCPYDTTGDGETYPNFACDVSLPGGGGELAMSSLTIVSGVTYTLQQIQLTIPSEFIV